MKIETKKIDSLCSVIVGVTNNLYAEDSSSEAGMKLLRGVDISPNGRIALENMEQVKVTSNRDISHCLLQEGDVVVLARGSSIRACFIDAEAAKANILASANFIIIRPEKEKLLGEVLASYLGSAFGQSSLLSLSAGAVIQHIPASKLRTLEIPIPSMENQKQIAQLFYAGREVYESTMELAEQQKKTVEAKIFTLMQQETA